MRDTMQQLTDRLDRLERSNRRYRRGLVAAGLLVATGVGMSAAQDAVIPDLIQARSFEVVDDQGRPLVHLFSTMGVGAIGTSDEQGNLLVALVAERVNNDFVGAVTTLNSAGNQVVQLGGAASGHGTVTTFDGDGTRLVQLGVTDSGHGSITARSSTGAERVVMGVGAEGDGTFVAYSQKDAAAVQFGGSRGGGVIQVNNYAGSPVCIMDADEQGHGQVEVLDRTGRGRVMRPRW